MKSGGGEAYSDLQHLPYVSTSSTREIQWCAFLESSQQGQAANTSFSRRRVQEAQCLEISGKQDACTPTSIALRTSLVGGEGSVTSVPSTHSSIDTCYTHSA